MVGIRVAQGDPDCPARSGSAGSFGLTADLFVILMALAESDAAKQKGLASRTASDAKYDEPDARRPGVVAGGKGWHRSLCETLAGLAPSAELAALVGESPEASTPSTR